MSGNQPRTMWEPPPSSQPSSGQRYVPEQLTNIPGQDRSFNCTQPSTHLQNSVATLANTGDCGIPGMFLPPAPPPPLVNCSSTTMPHPHSQPSSMFSQPPPPPLPPVAARFSQPPPPFIPSASNIPYQAFWPGDMMAPGGQRTMHHSLPPIHHVGNMRAPGHSTHLSYEERVNIDSDEEESIWLQSFENRIKSFQPSPLQSRCIEDTLIITNNNNIKLADVQRLVVESRSLKEQLCCLEKELSQLDQEQHKEWNELVKQTEAVKFGLSKILKKFQDKGFIEQTKSLLKQRRAKRKRVKARKKDMRLEREHLRRKRDEEEAEIDAWRAKLQREAESKRREEAVKREADSILGEVRHKQTEGQRMLQLLEALTLLRRTRATQAAAQGQAKDTEAERRFTSTTDVIANIVRKQLQEYELEEQTLRVMMEESASHRSIAHSVKAAATIARFEDFTKKLLFGTTSTPDADLTLATLIQRRQEWDQFVVEGDSPLASAVPLSWVLPPSQPSPHWAAFLKR